MPNRQTVVKFVKHCMPLAVIAVLLLAVTATCGPAPTPTTAAATRTPVPTPTANPSPTSPTMTPEHGWELPADKYLFIDHHVHVEGVCVEGECQPGPMIDFPTYTFAEETGTLNSWFAIKVNDDLKVVYGNGMSLGGAAGGGAGTQLTEVYTIPAEIEGLRIVQVDRDGTVYLEYGGELLVLAPGESWTNTTEEVREQGAGKARLTTTDRIVNYGVLDKVRIVFPTPQP
jgi:hypothetical protein